MEQLADLDNVQESPQDLLVYSILLLRLLSIWC